MEVNDLSNLWPIATLLAAVGIGIAIMLRNPSGWLVAAGGIALGLYAFLEHESAEDFLTDEPVALGVLVEANQQKSLFGGPFTNVRTDQVSLSVRGNVNAQIAEAVVLVKHRDDSGGDRVCFGNGLTRCYTLRGTAPEPAQAR